MSVALLSCFAASACVVSETRPVEYIPAVRADTEVPTQQRLNIGISVFDPGIPEEGTRAREKMRVPPDVREAESRYLAYQLKETLERTGQWGEVRVVPESREGTELSISGEIIDSDGETLEMEVKAQDATGKVWLERKYEGRADSGTYTDGELLDRDPFQNIYNDISNDLLTVRSELAGNDLDDVRRVAELRFAADLAPEVFEGTLTEDRRGDYEITRLPAEGDEMMVRMRAIRERDYLFVDTLNEYYQSFYRQMEEPYDTWRRYSYDEAIALRELQAAARWRKFVGAAAVVGAVMADTGDNRTGAVARDVALLGGIELFRQGLQVSKEAKMQAEVLAELGTSFGAEIEPAVIEIAGETHRLEGSAATQYNEWKRLLREIYQSETGVDQSPNGTVSQPVSSMASGDPATTQ
jgi:hypothetical protein